MSDEYIDFDLPELTKIPFGKYRGDTIREVYEMDEAYLRWFFHEVNGNEDVKKQISQCFKGDVPEPDSGCDWADDDFGHFPW